MIFKLKLIYSLNILVAGIVGYLTLFQTGKAVSSVFSKAVEYSGGLKVVGSFWLAIAIASLIGLFYPVKMVPLLIIQLLYKSLWLLVVAVPVWFNVKEGPLPNGIALFFILWVIILPFIIPFKTFFE